MAVRGILVFALLIGLLGFLWGGLSTKVADDKAYEERLLGALSYLEESVLPEVTNAERVRLFAPNFQETSEPNNWMLSGILMTVAPDGSAVYGSLAAELRVLCENVELPDCWERVRFSMDSPMAVAGDAPSSGPDRDPGSWQDAGQISPGRPRAIEEQGSRQDSRYASNLDGAAGLPSNGGGRLPSRAQQDPAQGQAYRSNGSPIGTASQSAAAAEDGQLRGATGGWPEGGFVFEDEMVRRLQTFLMESGYELGQVDGIFGPRTVAAMRAFQRRNGMSESDLPTQEFLRRIDEISQ